jgi:CRISPR-associated protein Cmr5
MQQTMQQQRAAYALKRVQDASHNPHINQKEYKSYASQLPAMIHMNGLGQAAAFFRAKGGTHLELYNVLSNWLCNEQQPYHNCNDLLEGITTKDMHHYRLAQAEAQMLMDWVKKFAKAYMTDETSAQKSEGQTT